MSLRERGQKILRLVGLCCILLGMTENSFGASLTMGEGITLVITTDKTLSLDGDWINKGSFIGGTSTIIFEGTNISTISGDNTFYNLTCTVGGKQINFAAGSTQTIENILTLKGGGEGYIKLRSSEEGKKCTMNLAPFGRTFNRRDRPEYHYN